MPLDSTRAASKNTRAVARGVSLTKAVLGSFAEIGHTSMPRVKGTHERFALEYWVSSLLAQAAELRREKAKKAAIAAGVIPDYVTEPFAVGVAEVVYVGTLVTIGVKVVSQTDRVNTAGLVADLQEAGVPKPLLRKLLKKHTKVFPGAHIFTASLTE